MSSVSLRRRVASAAFVLTAVLLAGCSKELAPVNFIAEGKPEKLSDWSLMAAQGDRLVLNAGVEPYDLNTPLFTDYAHKLRTIWMPKGAAAKYEADKAFDFPVGTVISKTFYYPRGEDGTVVANYDVAHDFDEGRLNLKKVRLIETRLLVRRADGWVALPYVWNAAQTEAVLQRTGEQVPLELIDADKKKTSFTYVVPNVNQCASCHVADLKSREFSPLGPKARHMNRDYTYGAVSENQLAHLTRVGYLTGAPEAKDAPRNVDWSDKKAELNARARAYLDINCAHCHSNKGTANTTALHLEIGAPANQHLGLCKPPVAAGSGTGGHMYGIYPGKPDESIMTYRMNSAEPGVMMPELGRGTVHREGVALIREWIAAMKESCN